MPNWQQRLPRGSGLVAGDPQFIHMREVEHLGSGARACALGQQPGPVLHPDRITGKRHHVGAMCTVHVPQR